jgi:hypothetical protein
MILFLCFAAPTFTPATNILTIPFGSKNCGRTTNTGVNLERIKCTVLHARPAFDAGVLIDQSRLTIFHNENAMRTDLYTPSTACAFTYIIGKSDYS